MIKYVALEIKRFVIKNQPVVKHLLHNLHGQFSGFHSFIFNLNSSRLLFYKIQCDTIYQILGSTKVKVSVPQYTFLTLLILNSVFFLNLQCSVFSTKASLTRAGGEPFFNSNNSKINNWIFLLCMVVKLSLPRSSVSEDV